MSKEQLKSLLQKLKADTGLQEKFKNATNLDAALDVAKEAGFTVSKADWLENKSLIGPHWLWEWTWI